MSLPFASSATAASCPADPLGTARVLKVGTQGGLFVGLKSYPAALPLAEGEFVLTFDDGPLPGTTAMVLDALACEGVKATFFMIGRNAQANPALARRVRAAGHTIACHTWSHPWTMRQRDVANGKAEIDRGFKAIADAIGERPAPFFRYPGFADTPELNTWLAGQDIGVFGCDFWASDWVVMTPKQELTLVTGRMEKAGRGIVLFHDTHHQTAAMIPEFLRVMKHQGRSVVHLERGAGTTLTLPAPAHWTKGVS
jgi:peptidoglycan/xylan/chitin deacetylase (PgdA/CDA1 family)